MTLEQLIRTAILVSIMLIVVSLALRATWRDATYLFRNPPLLLRSLLAMNVLMPIFAATLVGLFTLRPAVAIALLALSVSPVPPFLPRREMKLVAEERQYIHGLLGTTALLTVLLAPLTVALLALAFSAHVTIEPARIARVVALTVLAPFALGLIIKRVSPAFAERASPATDRAGLLLLLVAAVAVLIKLWPAMIALVGDGTLLAIVAFVAVGLAVGHLLGGPSPDTRPVLALATAMRHPGVAAAVAFGTLPGDKAVAPALALYLLVAFILTIPYVKWRRRQRGG
jgi:BASS family bile acid:Na+ symporter